MTIRTVCWRNWHRWSTWHIKHPNTGQTYCGREIPSDTEISTRLGALPEGACRTCMMTLKTELESLQGATRGT